MQMNHFRKLRFTGYAICLSIISFIVGVNPVHGQDTNAFRISREGRFYAFSLREAEARLKEIRDVGADLRELGGITQVAGFVVDDSRQDLIIVGKVEPGDAIIELDDLVVALRSYNVYGTCPLVSIDRNEDTERTKIQVVRMEGGIEDTKFGRDLLAADIVLKHLGLGYLPSGVDGLHSYYDSRLEEILNTGVLSETACRFWFIPMRADIAVREGVGVVAIRRMNIGVRAQIMGACVNGKEVDDITNVSDRASREFALELTTNYHILCENYPEVARLKQLFDLVKLSNAISTMDNVPDLNYWLHEYRITSVQTPRNYELVLRGEDVNIQGQDKVYTISGGIEMRTLVLRLQDGDATALRHAVVHSRPSEQTLAWEVPIEGWRIPGSIESQVSNSKSAAEIVAESGRGDEKLGCWLSSNVVNSSELSGALGNKNLSFDSGNQNIYRFEPATQHGLGSPSPFDTFGNHTSLGGFSTNLSGLTNGPTLPSSIVLPNYTHYDSSLSLGRGTTTGFRAFDSLPTMSTNPVSPLTDFPDVRPGGVLINQTAKIDSLDGLSIEGVVWNEDNQRLGIILEGEIIELPQTYLDDFIAIVQSVYAGIDPGVSIDPGPSKNVNNVRYIGCVEGTRLGWSMFEADRLLKCYTLGRNNLTGEPMNPGIPGFRSLLQIWEDVGTRYSGAMMRMWFVPTEIRASRAGDSLIFDDVRVEVKTEYMALELKEETDEAAMAFINFFNDHYDEFAAIHPEIRDLEEYAKLVALVKYLRDRGVPMNWMIFTNNSRGIRYDTPATTPGYTIYAEETGSIGIWGGVNMTAVYESFEPSYETVPAFVSPVTTVYNSPAMAHLRFVPIDSLNIGSEIPTINFTQGDATFTSFDFPSSIKTLDGRRLTFQTDAVITGSGPVVELTRYYDRTRRDSGEFGNGWHLLKPYEIALSDTTFIYQDLEIPETVTVTDPLSGEEQILGFREEEERAGYYPEEDENLKALYILNDLSYLLEDVRGGKFHFDPDGRLTVVDMGNENRWAIGYRDDKPVCLWGIPKELLFDWSETVQAGYFILPHKIVVSDRPTAEVLIFTEDADGNLGFFPEESERWKGLYILSNGWACLEDHWGNSFLFDSKGEFDSAEINTDVSTGTNLDIHCIELVYDENDRIIEAVVGGQGRVQYLQDRDGNLTLKMGMDGVARDYEYDSRGTLITSGIGETGGGGVKYVVIFCILALMAGGSILLAVKRSRKLTVSS